MWTWREQVSFLKQIIPSMGIQVKVSQGTLTGSNLRDIDDALLQRRFRMRHLPDH